MPDNETIPVFTLHRIDEHPSMVDFEHGGGLSRRFYIEPAAELSGPYLAAIAVRYSLANSPCEVRQIVSTPDKTATVFEAFVAGQNIEAADRLERALDDVLHLANLAHDERGIDVLHRRAEAR